MEFVPKKTKGENQSAYKTLCLKEGLIKKIERIAKENDIFFNNVVVSMIETCLKIK